MKLTGMAVAAAVTALATSAFAALNINQSTLQNDSSVSSQGNIQVSINGTTERLQSASMNGANVTFTLANGSQVPAVFHNATEADWFMQFLAQVDSSYNMTIVKTSPFAGISGGNGSGGSGIGGLAGELGGLLHGGSSGSGSGSAASGLADSPLGNVLGGLRAGGANSVNFFEVKSPNTIILKILAKNSGSMTASCGGTYTDGDVIIYNQGSNPNFLPQVSLAPTNGTTLDAFTDEIRDALQDQGYYFDQEGQTNAQNAGICH